jgi:hypothetical protein
MTTEAHHASVWRRRVVDALLLTAIVGGAAFTVDADQPGTRARKPVRAGTPVWNADTLTMLQRLSRRRHFQDPPRQTPPPTVGWTIPIAQRLMGPRPARPPVPTMPSSMAEALGQGPFSQTGECVPGSTSRHLEPARCAGEIPIAEEEGLHEHTMEQRWSELRHGLGRTHHEPSTSLLLLHHPFHAEEAAWNPLPLSVRRLRWRTSPAPAPLRRPARAAGHL